MPAASYLTKKQSADCSAMRIEWAEPAIEDLIAIRDFIAKDSPHYARKFIERLFDAVRSLEEHPLIGRHVPETVDHPDVRELIYHNYRLIYRIRADCVSVLAVVHGRRDLSGTAPPWETR